MKTKAELRSRFRKSRDAFAAEGGQEVHESIALNLMTVWSESNQGTWLGYRASGSEADPALAIRRSPPSIRWAYPRVEGENLRFYIPQSEQAWLVGSWGIMEPDPKQSNPIDHSEAEGALVPALAFDQKGHRLGSGKGFYDRALNKFSGLKVGVAYETQFSHEELPREEHDIPMDIVVTNAKVVRVRKELEK